jgi:hypothetical protein
MPFTIKHLMPPVSFVYEQTSILREEEFGAIKTLKRLDHTNPSVGIDGMKYYQAT